MKRAVVAFPLMLILAAFGLTGCATHHEQAQQQDGHQAVFVAPSQTEPTRAYPTPQEDVLGAPPGSHWNWVEGYWANADWHWFWVPGHWDEQRPQAGVWVPGHWDRHAGQWIWRPGHWENP